MKKLVLAALAALSVCACATRTADPVHEAITHEIIDNMDKGFTEVRINHVELIDSTTFATEFERRIKLFEAKRDADSKLSVKYLAEGKKKNSALKASSYVNDIMILVSLDSLRKASSDILEKVAYYDYKFSAVAKGPDSSMEFKDAYAAVTPDFKVIGMTAALKDLHKGLGRVIPGYLEIVKGDEDASE